MFVCTVHAESCHVCSGFFIITCVYFNNHAQCALMLWNRESRPAGAGQWGMKDGLQTAVKRGGAGLHSVDLLLRAGLFYQISNTIILCVNDKDNLYWQYLSHVVCPTGWQHLMNQQVIKMMSPFPWRSHNSLVCRTQSKETERSTKASQVLTSSK